MKKLTLILAFLLGISFSVCSQIPRFPFPVVTTVGESEPEPEYCDEYQAVYNAMTTKPSSSVAEAQNTLVETLVTDGVWAEMDVFYVFASHTNSTSEALINWKNPGTYNATASGSPTFTAYQGFTGDGDDAQVQLYNPSTQGTNFTQNDASFGAYVYAIVDENAAIIAQGTRNTIIPDYSGNVYWKINYGSNIYGPANSSAGMVIATRSASNATALYIRGTSAQTGSQASTALQSYPFYALANPDSYQWGTATVSMAFCGGNLSSTLVTSLTNGFATYMSSID